MNLAAEGAKSEGVCPAFMPMARLFSVTRSSRSQKTLASGTLGSEPTSDAVQHQLNLSYRWRHNWPTADIQPIVSMLRTQPALLPFAASASHGVVLMAATRTKRSFNQVRGMTACCFG